MTFIYISAKSALNACLSNPVEGNKKVSILDLPGDVLIVPQATLGGTLKGKLMQYHRNIDKEEGLNLYKEFVSNCENTMSQCPKVQEANKQVKHGTYGNIQVLKTDTDGPWTALLEL